MVLVELLEDELGRIIVLRQLEGAGAHQVGAGTPGAAGRLHLLDRCLGIDHEELGAEDVHEGRVGILQLDRQMGIILHLDAGALGGGAVDHIGSALDEVDHIEALVARCRIEHALD